MYIVWRYADGPGEFFFIEGTGKWKGIRGRGNTLGMASDRADDGAMPKWEFHWEIEE
jgi:hypothetical protein